jgi:hypothetical protein
MASEQQEHAVFSFISVDRIASSCRCSETRCCLGNFSGRMSPIPHTLSSSGKGALARPRAKPTPFCTSMNGEYFRYQAGWAHCDLHLPLKTPRSPDHFLFGHIILSSVIRRSGADSAIIARHSTMTFFHASGKLCVHYALSTAERLTVLRPQRLPRENLLSYRRGAQ